MQRRDTLDYVIDAYVERDPPEIARAALQLGIYQLLFLDGVADHAAVGESVELLRGHRAAGMVNAVLRKVAREGFEFPTDETPSGAALTTRTRAGSSTCGGTGSAPRRPARCSPRATARPSARRA